MSTTIEIVNLPTTGPTLINMYVPVAANFALVSTVPIAGGNESTYVYASGPTNVTTRLVVRSTLDKNVRRVSATIFTTQVVTDSTLGEIARDPVSVSIGFNWPTTYADTQGIFRALTSVLGVLLGDVTSNESDDDATADLYRGITVRYPWK